MPHELTIIYCLLFMIYSSYTNNKTEKKTFIEIIRENEPPMLRIQTCSRFRLCTLVQSDD